MKSACNFHIKFEAFFLANDIDKYTKHQNVYYIVHLLYVRSVLVNLNHSPRVKKEGKSILLVENGVFSTAHISLSSRNFPKYSHFHVNKYFAVPVHEL